MWQPNAYAALGAWYDEEKLATGLRLTFQQVQKYEKGANRMGSSRLQQAADVLGVAVPFFFEGEGGGLYQPDGSAPSPAYIGDFVASEEGPRLAKAFMRLRPAIVRRIVDLVNEIAGRKHLVAERWTVSELGRVETARTMSTGAICAPTGSRAAEEQIITVIKTRAATAALVGCSTFFRRRSAQDRARPESRCDDRLSPHQPSRSSTGPQYRVEPYLNNSGRGSGMKPSRFGICTGQALASRTVALSMMFAFGQDVGRDRVDFVRVSEPGALNGIARRT